MKHTLPILILLCTLGSYSQTLQKAKIFCTNGDIKEGYAEMPSNQLLNNAISFKADKQGKATKIKDEDIDKAIYYSDNGNEFYFENTPIRFTYGKKMEKTQKRKDWLLITFHQPSITVFNYAQTYYIDKEGKMVSRSVDNSGTWADIFVCFRRPGEEIPTVITSFSQGAHIIGKDKQFRTAAIRYFEGDTKFCQRIEQKEFEHDQVRELAEAYVVYKEKGD